MITIKKNNEAGAPAKVLTIEELVDGIAGSLDKTNGVVTGDRLHSVDSHLRTAIRTLGYKPRETRDAGGKVTTSLPELVKQLQACIADTTEVTEDQHQNLHLHLTATNSNCAAEVGVKAAPELKTAPTELKAAPEAKSAAAKVKGAALAAMLMMASLLFGFAAQAADSFNITNVIGAGTATISSFPTNSISTNPIPVTYFTNGSVVSTNGGFYPGQQTGRGIEVRNYTYNGFKFTGVAWTTNNGTIWFQPIRAITAGTPPAYTVITNGGNNTVQYSDWETVPQANFTIAVPVPTGSNICFTFITNFDEWFEKPADFVGFNMISNNLGTGMVWNASAWLGKKIQPISLSGGN